MQVRLATLGRAHGLRGEIAAEVHTDDPAKLAAGAVLATEPPSAGPLTVTRTRHQSGRLVLSFAEVPDRTAAEALRGVELVAEVTASDEEDAWYPFELQGLRVELTDGTVVGEVVGLDHLPAHDVLVVRETNGERTLVPFVRAIVPVVDVPGGRVVLDPPGGLLTAIPADAPSGEPSDRADDPEA